MDLSIIIVNWNSVEYLQKCLESLRTNLTTGTSEVIVIDNASDDDCDTVLRHRFSEVKVFRSPVNLGFAGANNYGFSLSSGKRVLFLNPDTELTENALSELVSAIDRLPHAGVVGAHLLNTDLTIQDCCVQSFPTIINQLLDADVLRRRTRRSRLWGNRVLFEEHPGAVAVDVVSGACMMTTRRAYEAVGGFSTAYFMYSDDVDFCHRLSSAGWKCYYDPAAVVIHHGGVSTAKRERDAFAAVMLRESRFRYFSRWRGLAYARLYRAAIGTAALARAAACLLVGGLLKKSGSERNRIPDAAYRWFKVWRWATGLERWAERQVTVGPPETALEALSNAQLKMDSYPPSRRCVFMRRLARKQSH